MQTKYSYVNVNFTPKSLAFKRIVGMGLEPHHSGQTHTLDSLSTVISLLAFASSPSRVGSRVIIECWNSHRT